MKFIKGVIVGTVISTGVYMLYKESNMSGKNMMKQSKKFMKNIGIMN